MTQKSHVSLGQHQCPICLTKHDSGEVLLHRQLRATLEPKTVTGYQPCPDCQEKLDRGFIALVETVRDRPGNVTTGLAEPRTDNFAFIKDHVYETLFERPVPSPPMAFVTPGLLQKLQEMLGKEEDPS